MTASLNPLELNSGAALKGRSPAIKFVRPLRIQARSVNGG
jgi:hypothetical protein